MSQKESSYQRWRRSWPLSRPSFWVWLCAYFELYWRDHGFLRPFYNAPFELAPGVWRSNQPSPARLRKLARQGFKTIVNLRGVSEHGFHFLERQACDALGLKLLNLKLYSRQMPSKAHLQALHQGFMQLEKPALLHCKSGADRAGLAAALYLIMMENRPVEEAMEQLSWRFLHVRAAKTGRLDYMLQAYARAIALQPMAFMDWVEHHYQPEQLQAEFKPKGLANWLVDGVLRRE